MRIRHRAFALLIVLVAVAGVFALGLRSAASARAVQLESRVMSERVVGERLARTAAVLVLRGLTTAPTADNRSSNNALASSGPGGGSDSPPALADAAAEEDKKPDLPAILREMLGENAEAAKKAEKAAQAGAARLSDGAGLTGRRTRATDGLALLQRVGLPSKPIDVTVEDRRLRVTLADAGGLLNVNTVDEVRFAKYLTLKGVDSSLAARIANQLMDWRDADSFERQDGAESATYERRGLACRNGDLFALEELLYLPAMTRDIFERIRPDLCAGGDGKAHLGSAPAEVLLSIDGMSPSAIDQILSLRANGRLTQSAVDSALRGVWDKAKEQLRFQPSGFVRVTVETLGRINKDNGLDRVKEARRFEGIGVVSDTGVNEIGLRSL
jgi:hypothetical protein